MSTSARKPCNSSSCLPLSWQALHRLCSLPSANSFQSPRCGSIWSATVAGVTRPRSRQNRHRGSIWSWYRARRFQAARPYQRSAGTVCGLIRRPRISGQCRAPGRSRARPRRWRPVPSAAHGPPRDAKIAGGACAAVVAKAAKRDVRGEASRVHHAARWRGGARAAAGTRAQSSEPARERNPASRRQTRGSK